MAKHTQIPGNARWAPLSLIVALCATGYLPRSAAASSEELAQAVRRCRCACVTACVEPNDESLSTPFCGLSVVADARDPHRIEAAVEAAAHHYPLRPIVYRAPKRGPPASTV